MKQRKVISLPTDNRKIYRQILAFMNFLLNLTPQERNILAEFIRLNNEYEALPIDKRIKFILSTDTRKEICSILNMDAKQFNVILSKLKKKTFGNKPLLDEIDGIHKELCFKPDNDGFRFEVNFVMTAFVEKKREEWQEPIQEPAETAQYPRTTEEAFKPETPYDPSKDASRAPVIEEEEWDIEIVPPNE